MADATGSPSLSYETHVVASDAQVSAELAHETVILSMHDGNYYGLDDVGSLVWGLLREARSMGELAQAVSAAFDVGEEGAFADLCVLVAELAERGLVDIRPAAAN